MLHHVCSDPDIVHLINNELCIYFSFHKPLLMGQNENILLNFQYF